MANTIPLGRLRDLISKVIAANVKAYDVPSACVDRSKSGSSSLCVTPIARSAREHGKRALSRGNLLFVPLSGAHLPGSDASSDLLDLPYPISGSRLHHAASHKVRKTRKYVPFGN